MADPRPRVLVVDGGCTSCPFFFHDEGDCDTCGDPRVCTHPKYENDAHGYGKSLKRANLSRRPKWCPLNQRPVLVTLEARHG